ncbi:hypothetical protein BEP19_10170 [Ammoniphilus oxalaticus]|uniref:LD-carboxypeptidase n=1 Tax=Ammoniphilus oxalaticus TaxID=66863 RepID=A0A419SFR3_9BACL|nr:LD-carboxypeptidase [Ammoniphilus oxalaticus]RKD22617.1 hypothetical protein BEP19_10170 [Ammoniphilus oxalaticus]
MRLVKPKALSLGDTIGVIAPASPVLDKVARTALTALQDFGFNLKLGDTVSAQYGYLAGSDQLRANDINRMFADPEVKAIFCMRGGYGTPRILEAIDYDLIRRCPKVFVGYSDITALHLAILKYAGLVTFHGPMIAELANEPAPMTWPTLFQHVMDPCPWGRYVEPKDMLQCVMTPGMATGPLVGGNLSLICATLGTPYEIETTGRILFLEDVGEEPYAIDRMLSQLKLAGKLQVSAGIVLADFDPAPSPPKKKSLTLEQVFADILKPLGIPCYYGLKAGHCDPNLTMPIGVETRLNAAEGWIEFLEGGVV